VALWLCTGEVRLSARALDQIENADLRISPIVLLEMRLLQEVGRVNIGPDEWLAMLRRDFGVAVCRVPLHRIVAAAFSLSWGRDPFDRLIVAHAIAGAGKLITKDQRIHENFDGAIW
jgi:PIN domain nuclease of toxin-antitoxin system